MTPDGPWLNILALNWTSLSLFFSRDPKESEPLDGDTDKSYRRITLAFAAPNIGLNQNGFLLYMPQSDLSAAEGYNTSEFNGICTFLPAIHRKPLAIA